MPAKTFGLCKFCGTAHNKSVMLQHIRTCKARKAFYSNESPDQTYFTLLIASAQEDAYWVIVEMPADGLLRDLDGFLRQLWFDTGDHLSVFNICNLDYVTSPMGNVQGEKSQVIKLSRAIKTETAFTYAFDFATPSICNIRVLGTRKGTRATDPTEVCILSRNIPPEYLCCDCGKPASLIHTEALWHSRPEFICKSCLNQRILAGFDDVSKAEETEDFVDKVYIEGYDPIHNSPRMLQEGYVELHIPDVFVPDVTKDL